MYRRKVVSLVRDAQLKENEKILAEGIDDSRKSWKHMNNILRNRDAPVKDFCSSLKINDSLISNRVEISDRFNEYFANVVTKIKSDITKKHILDPTVVIYESYDINVSYRLPLCTIDEAETVIKTLKTSDAEDFYGFSKKIMKLHAQPIAPSLCELVNKSISSGDYPDVLKVSIVKLLFKGGGDKTFLNNYRLKSLCMCFSPHIRT